jgi:hypothetical protein
MTSFWNLPVLRLIATDRCRVAAPWFAWAHGPNAGSNLRRRANALERRRLGADHPFEQTAAALLYLVLSVPRVLLALRRSGRGLRASARVSYVRQCLHLYLCAWRLGLRPQVYYYLRLHEQQPSGLWREVIDPSELHYLQSDVAPAEVEPLQDKLCFTARARSHGLPVIPLLAVWEQGRARSHHDDEPTLCRDLFVKRARSYGSAGVMAFHYNPITGAHHDDRRRYSLSELIDTLREASRDYTLLVQPRLKNHPDIAGFSALALCNYRIVTGRHPNGRTEVLMAALRFPLNSELTCAEHDVTVCAAVDLATGKLFAAESKDPALGRLARHPLTGQQIEGFAVPRWREMCALACRAHDAWPDFPFIGWDISDTADGLFLLEGGYLWGGYLAQMSGSPPLGLTPFAAIYAEHLAHRAASAPAS